MEGTVSRSDLNDAKCADVSTSHSGIDALVTSITPSILAIMANTGTYMHYSFHIFKVAQSDLHRQTKIIPIFTFKKMF